MFQKLHNYRNLLKLITGQFLRGYCTIFFSMGHVGDSAKKNICFIQPMSKKRFCTIVKSHIGKPVIRLLIFNYNIVFALLLYNTTSQCTVYSVQYILKSYVYIYVPGIYICRSYLLTSYLLFRHSVVTSNDVYIIKDLLKQSSFFDGSIKVFSHGTLPIISVTNSDGWKLLKKRDMRSVTIIKIGSMLR